MDLRRFGHWLKTNIHPTECWFFIGSIVRFAAFTAWGKLIVRLIRGEEAKEDWRTLVPSAALITFTTLTSAGEARELASLRGAAVGMQDLVDNAAAQAELREQRAAERDRQAAEQQKRMLATNERAVKLAAITLATAILTLVVALVVAIAH